MARVKFTAAVSEIRGSLGGSTFQGNRFGFSLKNKPQMPATNSTGQGIAKAIFTQVVTTWRSMSESDRQAWATFATSYPQYSFNGSSVALSGFEVFIKFNVLAINAGESILLVPSSIFPTTQVRNVILESGSNGLSMDLNYSTFLSGDKFVLYASKVLSDTANTSNLRMRSMGSYSAASSVWDIADAYIKQGNSLPEINQFIVFEFQVYQPYTPFLYSTYRLTAKKRL